ncbi:MAG: ABC transporter permease [Sutterella sp.]|nr:ABC transporter permease [Sutterella sp.]
MRNFAANVWNTARWEMGSVWRRPQEWVTGLVLPLIWCLLMVLLFSEGLMTGLPVGVVNLDQGSEARTLLTRLDALPSVDVRPYENPLALEAALKAGKVYAGITIPNDYTQKTLASETPPVTLTFNKSYYAIGTILEVDLKMALADITRSRGAQSMTKLRGGSIERTSEVLGITEPDIAFEGNQSFNFSRYLLATLVPGLLVLAQAIVMAGVLVRDWRDKTLGSWLTAAAGNRYAALLGKLLPWMGFYLLVDLAWVAWFAGIEGWGVAGFTASQTALGLAFWCLATVVLVLAVTAMVLFLTSVSLTWVIAISGTVALFAPTFPFTSFSFPFESMTPGAVFFGHLLPLTHYLKIQGECMVLGSPATTIMTSIGVLGLFVVLPGIAGVLFYTERLKVWLRQEATGKSDTPPTEPIPAFGFLRTVGATLKRIATDRDTVVIALLAMGFYLVFYAWPYGNQQITHIPTIVLDLDQSALSRRTTMAIDASPTVDLVAVLTERGEAERAYREEKAAALVTIPSGYEERLSRGENATLHLVSNGAYPVKGRALQAALSGVVLDATQKEDSASLLLTEMPMAVLARQLKLAHPSAIVEYRYNEIGGYGNYTVPVAAPVILQAVFLMLVTLGLGGWLRDPRHTPIASGLRTPGRLTLALILAFTLLAYLWFLYMQGFDFWVNEYGSLKNPVGVFTVGALFTLDVAAFALMITALMGSNQFTSQLVVMFSAPAVFMSGAIWPLENVPYWLTRIVANSLPSTPGVQAIVGLSQDGARLTDVMPQVTLMGVQTLLYALLAYLWLRRRTREAQRALP